VTVYLDRFMGKEVDLIFANTLGKVVYQLHLPEVTDKLLPIQLDRGIFAEGLYTISVVHKGRAQSKRLVVARF
jgi:hypothetical protein